MAEPDQSDAEQPAEAKAKVESKPKPKAKAKVESKPKAKGKAKDKKDKKGKKGKGGAAGGLSVAGHPRAAAAVKRAKGFGGIAGFGLAAYVSYGAGVPPDQIGLRALAFGVAGYMLAWACSVTIWRHLVLAELRAAVESGRATVPALADRTGNGALSAAGDGPAAKAPAGAPPDSDGGDRGDD